jgi:hypothetical protein
LSAAAAINQTCRSDYHTRENHAPSFRLQLRTQNLTIARVNNRVRDNNRRIRAHRHALLQRKKKSCAAKTMMKRKTRSWKLEIASLNAKLRDVKRKYDADPMSVNLEDWNQLTLGQERKLQILFGKKHPRKKWPTGVLYLNSVALAMNRAAKKERKIEALKKDNTALSVRSKPVAEVTVQWELPAAVQSRIGMLELKNAQDEKQHQFMKRSRADPPSVSFEQWQNSIRDTDILKSDVTIACDVELALRREMGEECDGWVFGRCYRLRS